MFRVKKRNGVLKSTWLLIGMLLGLQIALPKLLAQVPGMPDDPEFSSSSVNCLWFGGTGSWDEPANWSDCNDGVPGAGDTAIISAGQVDISGDVTIAGLEFLGGIINGPGTATSLTVTNALHLAGGEKSLALLTLVNEGIGQWTSGGWRLRLPSGGNTVGQFRNASGASFEVTGGVSMLNSFNETLSIVNDGELIKTGGGLADFNSSSVPMVNRGTIEVQQGVLRLPGGGATAPHEGSFTVATGARIEFTGPRHSFHLDSSVMGEGEVRFPGNGTWTLEAGMTYNVDGLTRVSDATDCPCRLRINTDAFTGSLQMQSGSGKFIEGINGSLTVTDTFDWHTGAIGQHFATGNFTLNVLGGITLHSGISAIAQRGIVNHYGTAVYESGTFYIRHPNARFVNHPGASFEIQGERLMSYRLGGSDPVLGVFENRGSLIKTGSEEAIIEGIAIENSGVIDVHAGSLRFTRHSSQTDPWAGARLILNDGVVNSQAPLIFENSRIYGQGVINADVEIDNDILIGSGSGGSYLAGILEINGNLDLAETSRILTPLVSDDPVPGSGYSLLQVNNSEPVELRGSLRVMVDSDFAEIEIGDEFEVINASGGLGGTFDAVEALTEGFEFSAVYETNRVLVRVQSLPGFNAPELVSPENGSLIEDLAATLQWNSVELAVSYQVQVSDDGDTFSELFADAVTSNTFFEISDLEPDKDYFWRVRSQRGSGLSEWSEAWSFITSEEPAGHLPGCIWTGAGSGNSWHTAANWICNGEESVPAPDDSVRIATTSPLTIDIAQDVEMFYLELGDDSVNDIVTTLRNTVDNVHITVGDGGTVIRRTGNFLLGQTALFGISSRPALRGILDSPAGITIHGRLWMANASITGDILVDRESPDLSRGYIQMRAWNILDGSLDVVQGFIEPVVGLFNTYFGSQGPLLKITTGDLIIREGSTVQTFYDQGSLGSTIVFELDNGIAENYGLITHTAFDSQTTTYRAVINAPFANYGELQVRTDRAQGYEIQGPAGTQHVNEGIITVGFDTGGNPVENGAGLVIAEDRSLLNTGEIIINPLRQASGTVDNTDGGTIRDRRAVTGPGLFVLGFAGDRQVAVNITEAGSIDSLSMVWYGEDHPAAELGNNLIGSGAWWDLSATDSNQNPSEGLMSLTLPRLRDGNPEACRYIPDPAGWECFPGSLTPISITIDDLPTLSEWTLAYEPITTLPPGVVTLIAPEDGEVGVSVNPTLSWEVEPQAASYRVQVSLSGDFTSTVADQAGIEETEFEVSGLDYESQYFWRVRAANDAGDGEWSEVWSFTTEEEPLSPPGVVALIAPENGEVGVSVNPTLSWEAVEQAAGYRVQVSLSSEFASTVFEQAGLEETEFEVSGLVFETQYFWRVRATNDAGDGEWSGVWSFTTEEEPLSPPGVVVLIAPEDEATDASLNSTLSWEAEELAASYRLQVSLSGDFALTVVDQAGIEETEFEVSGLDYETQYFWRVRATNNAGDGDWSEVWSYTTLDEPVENNPPVAVNDTTSTILNLPVDIDVLANDSDPDGDALQIFDFQNPSEAGGTVSLTGQNLLRYTPPQGFTGTDQFQYTITDGRDGFDSAIVIVEIFPVRFEITLSGSPGTRAQALNENGTLTGTLTENDGSVKGFYLNSESEFIFETGSFGAQIYGIHSNVMAGIVKTSDTTGIAHKFFPDGSTENLGTLGGDFSLAYDINENDLITGVSIDSNGRYRAFKSSQNGLEDAGVQGFLHSTGFSINRSGAIAGVAIDQGGRQRAFIDESVVGESDSRAYSINNDGIAVGSLLSEGEITAAIWESQLPATLLNNGGFKFTEAYSVNDAGWIAGVAGDVSSQSKLVQNSLEKIALSGKLISESAGVQSSVISQLRAVIWIGGTLFDLNDLIDPTAGWTLLEAVEVNSSGQIAGTGIHDGQRKAFLLTPVDENPPIIADLYEVATPGIDLIIDLTVLSGPNIKVVHVNPPQNGIVSILDDLKIQYRAPSGFQGNERFRYTLSNGRSVSHGHITVEVKIAVELPEQPHLSQNFPNPFNPGTVIPFTLPVAQEIRIEIFDLLGRRVMLAFSGELESGYHQISIDGSQLSSGTYFYLLRYRDGVQTKKMTLIK